MVNNLVVDTSVLMDDDTFITNNSGEYEIIISDIVLSELDNLKNNRDIVKSKRAKKAIWSIYSNIDKLSFDISNDYRRLELNNNDDRILSVAKDNSAIIATNDICMYIKSKSMGIDCIKLNKKIEYKGYQSITIYEQQARFLYSNLDENLYHNLINEYLIVNDLDTGITIDILKWTEDGYARIQEKSIKTSILGNIYAKDDIQKCAFDSIYSNDITILYGRSGSGKTTIPLFYAMNQIEKHKINKLYIVYSFTPLRNQETLGFEKGDHTEKVMNYAAIGNILSTNVGKESDVIDMISKGLIEIIPTANIRGVEFEEKSMVLCTEAQNLDTYTLKTIIQRCKKGCKQVYEGDILEQTDVDLFENGMEMVINRLKNTPRFGCVKLNQNYRDDLGQLIDDL